MNENEMHSATLDDGVGKDNIVLSQLLVHNSQEDTMQALQSQAFVQMSQEELVQAQLCQ